MISLPLNISIFLYSLGKSVKPCLWDCLSPHSDFHSLHTLFVFLISSKSGGISIYASSSRSPIKKAIFTSSWCRVQSRYAIKDNNTLIVWGVATISAIIFWSPGCTSLLCTFNSSVMGKKISRILLFNESVADSVIQSLFSILKLWYSASAVHEYFDLLIQWCFLIHSTGIGSWLAKDAVSKPVFQAKCNGFYR